MRKKTSIKAIMNAALSAPQNRALAQLMGCSRAASLLTFLGMGCNVATEIPGLVQCLQNIPFNEVSLFT